MSLQRSGRGIFVEIGDEEYFVDRFDLNYGPMDAITLHGTATEPPPVEADAVRVNCSEKAICFDVSETYPTVTVRNGEPTRYDYEYEFVVESMHTIDPIDQTIEVGPVTGDTAYSTMDQPISEFTDE